MARLRMNTESCRDVHQNIVSTRESWKQEVDNMKSRVAEIVGTDWIAPSANQLDREFQDWYSQVNALLQELESVENRLERKIVQWESIAERLG